MTERSVKHDNMAPKTAYQFNRIRNRRKKTLMNAALKLFSEKGFESVSISDIAKKADVSKGLLYNYFENKEDLVKEIVIDGTRKLTIDMDFDFSIKLTKERFVDLINKYFELIESGSDYWRLYISVLTQPRIAEMMKGQLFEHVSSFIVNVSEYYKAKNEKNPLVSTLLIGALLDGVSIDYMLEPENYPLNEIREIIINKLM